MSAPLRCGGPDGKIIFLTKESAKAALHTFRAKYGRGRGKLQRCTWGDHYHLTKGLTGQKGKGLR